MAAKKAERTRLNDAQVAAIKPPTEGQSFVWDTVQQGLGVRCTAAGSKAYIAQSQCNGKTVRVTLARTSEIDVKEARRRAGAATLMMRDGTNPVARKKQEKVESATLREVMENYLLDRRTKFGPLRDGSKRLIRNHIEGNLKAWADRPIAGITHTMVATRFREMSEKTKCTANLVMITLQSLCKWAAAKSIGPDGIPTVLAHNPVELAFRQLVKWNHIPPRTKRVPAKHSGAVWSLLHSRLNPDAYPRSTNQNAALVLALMLTGCRWNEMATLRFDAIHFDDHDGGYIEFDTKTHRILKVPLTTQLEHLLRLQHDRREPSLPWVFLGKTRRTHIKDTRGTMEKVSEACGLHLTPHDLRRSFTSSGAAVGVEKYVIDLLSGHVPQDVVGVHYLESNDLRAFLPQAQRIADHLEQQGAIYAAKQAGANVVELRSA